MDHYRELIKNKKRIVVKVGSSSLRHKETGEFDYIKMETLVRELCDIRNKGKDVILLDHPTKIGLVAFEREKENK